MPAAKSTKREYAERPVEVAGAQAGDVGDGQWGLELSGICKRLSGRFAVDNVNFAIERGKVLVVIGPSGSGKTTVLRLIAGLTQLDAGGILINGEAVDRLPPRRRRVGMMFQNFALFPHLTVAGNIRFGMKALKVDGHEADRRFDEVIDKVHLRELQSAYPRELSGGQQQRVALARALVTRPRILLLDEPFSSLDPQVRNSIRSELREQLAEAGVTTVVVSHDQMDAAYLGDRVALMRDGRLVQIGTYDELYQSPASYFAAEFVGEGNWVQGEVIERSPTGYGVRLLDDMGVVFASGGEEGLTVGMPAHVMVRRTASIDVRAGRPVAGPGPSTGCGFLCGALRRRMPLGDRTTIWVDCGRAGTAVLDISDDAELRDVGQGAAVTVTLAGPRCRVYHAPT